jgi:hypothetical protein
VVVGMSGGVDSSAAAALLLEQGYDVIGITLKLWPQDCVSRAEDKCCGPQAVTDARRSAHGWAFRSISWMRRRSFSGDVVEYFAAEYRAGRTPNPCVMCNEKLKFGTLLSGRRSSGGLRRHGALRASGTARGRADGTAQTGAGPRARTRVISCSRCGRSSWLHVSSAG